jgi:hypothetical protein
MEPVIVDNHYSDLAATTLKEANRFYDILQRSINQPSRFNNDLRYSMTLMTLEKYFVALMACYEELPTHHIPLGLFREAEQFESELTPSIKQTCILTGKFEGICSLEDFGYRTPANKELMEMLEGMREIKALVEKRVEQVR